jgi:acetyltransferase-like isoleucine patch superfamily enzyme
MGIKGTFDSPWKIRNEVERMIILPWVRLLFAINGISWGRGWRIHGAPIIQKHRKSVMRFGNGLGLRSSVRSNPLGPNRPSILCTWQDAAILEVGDYFRMTGGTVCAAKRIIIGDNVALGANSTVIDTDFHPLDPKVRQVQPQLGKSAPVIIEDNVFIGMNCIILKGVRLGKGCMVGAGSVVAKDVPAGSTVSADTLGIIRKAHPQGANSCAS